MKTYQYRSKLLGDEQGVNGENDGDVDVHTKYKDQEDGNERKKIKQTSRAMAKLLCVVGSVRGVGDEIVDLSFTVINIRASQFVEKCYCERL